jgi:hypothetical protein
MAIDENKVLKYIDVECDMNYHHQVSDMEMVSEPLQ